MESSSDLEKRVREALVDRVNLEEKRMFRGIAFMVDDKMCINVVKDGLMCRVDPEKHNELVQLPGCKALQMKGKDCKGYIDVSHDVLASDEQLGFWLELCLDFNKRAKRSAKRKK
jgi:TfoX/Sxy family transcriptional regulator of competence genes